MENHHEAEDEENTTDEEVEKLDEEVKSMAQKAQEYRQTFPHHFNNTLANVFESQRPPVSDLTRPGQNDSDPGPSSEPNIEAITPLCLEGGVEALVGKDPMHAEEVQRIKRKISDNVSAMSSLVKRIKDCTSRIEKLEESKQVMIYPAQEKNEAFSKNNEDKTTISIPSQKADHVGSSQNKKSYASSLNGDRDSKVEKQVIAVKGFSDVKLTYLGGMWVMIELDNEATKLKLLQHIGVNSWFHVLQAAIHDFVSDERVVWVDIEGADNILEKFKVIFKGKVYTARAKELFTWTSIFLDHKESEYTSDDESLHGAKNKSVGSQHEEDDLVDDSDVEDVSETFFGDKHPSPNNSVCNSSEKENDHRGVDLNTETDKVNSPLVHTKVMNNSQKVHENMTSNGESAFNYSHNAHNGGSILEVLDDMIRVMNNSQKVHENVTSNGESAFNYSHNYHNGGSILEMLDDMIRVGQSMGYAMEGRMKDIEHIIGTQGVDAVPK
nr:RNA-directed DNA polymerase, eukaryota [Tanacetum cinerariifolium]